MASYEILHHQNKAKVLEKLEKISLVYPQVSLAFIKNKNFASYLQVMQLIELVSRDVYCFLRDQGLDQALQGQAQALLFKWPKAKSLTPSELSTILANNPSLDFLEDEEPV